MLQTLLEFGGLPIIIAVSISAAIMLIFTFTIVLLRKRRSPVPNVEVPKKEMERVPSNTSIAILESRYFPSKRIDGLVMLPMLHVNILDTHTSYKSWSIGCRH